MSILIKNGKIVCEGKVVSGDVLIADGIVKEIGKVSGGAEAVIDAKGGYVLAGFVDLHTHLREPGLEYKEDIESGCRAAVAGGFTTLCCMPNTSPVIDSAPLVRYILERAKEVGLCAVLPIGAITKGSKGQELAEMFSMSKAGAVAFSDDGSPVESAGMFKTALEYAATKDLLIISHSEEKSLSEGGVVNEGESSCKAGLRGIPSAAEEVAIAREVILAKAVGARVHIAHVSTKGSVEIIRLAKRAGVKVTAETCPHYIALTDSEILSYNTSSKINPPLRSEQDRQAIIEGIKDGTIDCIATDHAPHGHDDKNKEYDYAAFGSTGLETAYAVCYTHLVKSGIIDIARLSQLLSENPAKIIGAASGIKIGAPACVTVADSAEYTVDASTHCSKGKNSVFNGKKLCGKIRATIYNGKLVYNG